MELEWYDKSILILGCGNVLLGDDGFGPALAQRLRRDFTVPAQVGVLDAGTSVREILFDTVLSDKKPSKIIIVDAMDCGLEPGELFSPNIDCLPGIKLDDFSMHQLPTSNLLRELRDLCDVKVVVMACQVSQPHFAGKSQNGDPSCTYAEVCPGLSDPVAAAVGRAAETLAKEHFH